MKYFEQYVSNTIAGSANQLFFTMEASEVRTGRVLYKITAGGEYAYSFLYTNIMDSTFFDGSISRRNTVCDNWVIHSARVGVCQKIAMGKDVTQMRMADVEDDRDADILVTDFQELTFDSEKSKEVLPGAFFATDPITLNLKKGDFICIEMTYSGKRIPYLEDAILPIYNRTPGGWEFCKKMPLPGMIGCNRKVKGRIGYLGDSITQGVGTDYNAYAHWTALLTEKIGDDYAGWNLGIGYARANDAASDGAWLYKAKQNDIIVLCLGINDIGRGFSADTIQKDLTCILETLRSAGIRVVLQSLPPYSGLCEREIETWKQVTAYIRDVLAKRADLYFDIAPHLYVNEAQPTESLYEPHPNASGCKVWADALYRQLEPFLAEQ